MKKIIYMIIAIILMSSCSTSLKSEPETCDLTEHKQVMDEMASSISKLKEQIHILGTQSNPDYSTIFAETSDLLDTTKKIQAPVCLEKSKELLISTIESTIDGIKLFQSGEPIKATNHINKNTQEILNQYIQELITVIGNQPLN